MIDQKTQEVRDSGEPTSDEVDEVLEEIIIAAAGARSSDARPIIIAGDGAWEVDAVPGDDPMWQLPTMDERLEVDRERLADLQPFLAAALEVFDPSPTDDVRPAADNGGTPPTGPGEGDAEPPSPLTTHGTDERPFA